MNYSARPSGIEVIKNITNKDRKIMPFGIQISFDSFCGPILVVVNNISGI
jgi:hypothetical protein